MQVFSCEFCETFKDTIFSNNTSGVRFYFQNLETATRMCSIKKVFLQISQNSQENSCVKVSFLIKLQAEAWNFI